MVLIITTILQSRSWRKSLKGSLSTSQRNTEHSLYRSKKKNENHKTITYEIKFLESLIFMASLLSSLADNLVEGLHKEKCKNCKSDLEYMAGNGGSL